MSAMLTRAEFDAEMAERDERQARWQRRLDANLQALAHRMDLRDQLWESLFTQQRARTEAALDRLETAVQATMGALTDHVANHHPGREVEDLLRRRRRPMSRQEMSRLVAEAQVAATAAEPQPLHYASGGRVYCRECNAQIARGHAKGCRLAIPPAIP